MIKLNPFAISGLLIGLSATGLMIVLFLHAKNNKLNKIYGLQVLTTAIWGFGSCLIGLSTNQAVSLVLWKIVYSDVIIIPVLFLHVVLLFCQKSRKIILLFAYLQAFFFIILNIFDKLFQIKFIFNSFYYPIFTWFGFGSFLIWISLVFYEHYELFRFHFEVEKNKQKQVFYLLLGAIIGLWAGITNFFPALNINFYPYGNFAVPIYTSIIAYAILRYQLMDINIVTRRGLVYSILITIFTIIYLSVVIFTERFFQGVFGYRSLLLSIISASIIALFFIPLKNKIQSFIDKIFLGKTPEQIAQENELLRQEIMRSEKLKAISTFASGMAHEIKNPLTAIKTFAEFLPQKIEDKEFLQRFSKIIQSESEKISDLVHQLLNFSKPAPLQLIETDIHKLLDDTLELLSSQFLKYSINVVKEFNANTRESNANIREYEISDNSRSLPVGQTGISDYSRLIIKVDPQQIKQVFLNLFLNAIEAMPSGGTLTVSTRVQMTENRQQKTDPALTSDFCSLSSAIICVQDTGNGIPEKDLPHIFEPFYTTKEKGTGLGLSIVYNIIKEHRGNIRVESKLNEGTKFIIGL